MSVVAQGDIPRTRRKWWSNSDSASISATVFNMRICSGRCRISASTLRYGIPRRAQWTESEPSSGTRASFWSTTLKSRAARYSWNAGAVT